MQDLDKTQMPETMLHGISRAGGSGLPPKSGPSKYQAHRLRASIHKCKGFHTAHTKIQQTLCEARCIEQQADTQKNGTQAKGGVSIQPITHQWYSKGMETYAAMLKTPNLLPARTQKNMKATKKAEPAEQKAVSNWATRGGYDLGTLSRWCSVIAFTC